MPEFAYTAMTKDGKKESATISAPSATAAGHLLKEQGLMPTRIEEQKKSSDIFAQLGSLSFISLAEKIVFIDNLAIMLKAGISVSRGLQILARQTKNRRFQKILLQVQAAVESGKTLAEALEKHPNVFNNLFTSMIKVGELSGTLDQSLSYLSVQLQREADLRSKTKGAMIYPSVIVGAMVIIGVLMSIFVLPKLTSIFKDFNSSLPPTTKAVIALADFMSAHGLLAIVFLLAAVVAVIMFLKTYTGKKVFGTLILYAFVLNTIVKKINLARFSRILSSLLKSGIPIVDALQVASESLSNIPYRELVAASAADVKLGKPLSESLARNNLLFPVLVVQMLQVGEESGTMANILEQLAAHYEEEVDTMLKNLSSIIEPLLLLVIGGVVGVLAMALIAPIYNISQSIN